eukprot:356298-Chlamydomonas_euryale.AAC.14
MAHGGPPCTHGACSAVGDPGSPRASPFDCIRRRNIPGVAAPGALPVPSVCVCYHTSMPPNVRAGSLAWRCVLPAIACDCLLLAAAACFSCNRCLSS